MSYISEIFDRMDIQQIREFLLHGVGCVEIDRRSYKQRIDSVGKEMLGTLCKAFPDMDEREKITEYIYAYANACQDVYMEIGLHAGITLTTQVLCNVAEQKT